MVAIHREKYAEWIQEFDLHGGCKKFGFRENRVCDGSNTGKNEERGGIGYTPNAVGPDRFIHKNSLSILEFISHSLKQTYQEEYHQVPQQ